MLAALAIMRPLAQVARGRGAVSMQALREGVGFVWTHPVILSMMALDFSQNFFGSGRALLPIYARDILGVWTSGPRTSLLSHFGGSSRHGNSDERTDAGTAARSVGSRERGYVWDLHDALRRLAPLLVFVPDARRRGGGQHSKLRSTQHDQSAGNTR